MRRRIDTHDLSDDTGRPYSWKHGDRLALYDEALWQSLVEARSRVSEIERAVYGALVEEPMDAVEVALCEESCALMDEAIRPDREMTSAEFVARNEDIQDRALRHAMETSPTSAN
jgi:hypothetical protein